MVGVSPVGSSVSQSTDWVSMTRELVWPDRSNFTGMVDPPLAWLIAGGPSTGGLKPPNTAAVQDAGRSKACTPSRRLFELPWLAPKPSPRLANARQISHRLVPAVSAVSAAR